MRRVSIAEIMEATGLSRATVDRVLNGRGRVHDRTRMAVEDSLRRLSQVQAAPSTARRADILLRVGRGKMQQLAAAWDAAGIAGRFVDLHLASEEAMLAAVAEACEDLSQPLIITAKNTPRLVARLREARARGKRVVAMISDLPREARDVFVGLDDRAAGETAAFLIGRVLGQRPTSVGVILGDVAFRCHEEREMGFRSGLRANFPKVVISGEAQGEDAAGQTRAAVLQMLHSQPGIAAIYNTGGGNQGMAEAIAEVGRSGDILVVGHEVNSVTLPLLREGQMDFCLANSTAEMLEAALEAAAGASTDRILQFGIHTRFNPMLDSRDSDAK